MRSRLLGLASSVLLSSTAVAQSRNFLGSVGVQHLESEGTGLAVLIGVSLSQAALTASLPFEITILPNSNSRYRMDTFSNGQSRCRDTTNGQFADTSLCGPRAVFGASADVMAFTKSDSSHSVGLGGGYRVGPSAGPFAAAAFVFRLSSGASWL
jgi:hypothetical protein